MERCEGPGGGTKRRLRLKELFLIPQRGEGAIQMNSYSGHEYSKEEK